MKIKSYHILFRLFSYLSDKTDGAPLFVRYKLLLGTLIISVANSSANTLSNMKLNNDTIPIKPDQAEITCYKSASPTNAQINSSEKVDVKGKVLDQSGESVIGVSITIKGNQTSDTITDLDGNFSLQAKMDDVLIFSFLGFNTKEVSVYDITKGNRPIVIMEDHAILCYDPVVIPASYRDDIYERTPKRITKLPYIEIQIPPVSPVGNLELFKEWIEEHIVYNELMLKDKVQGDVILSFAIDKQGKIVNKKVIGKLSPEADKEALRVLSSSQKWTPGEHNGKKIKTMLTMTVNFRMPE